MEEVAISTDPHPNRKKHIHLLYALARSTPHSIWWTEDGKKLIFAGTSDLFIVDPQRIEISRKKLASKMEPYSKHNYLQVHVPSRLGTNPFLYTPKMLYRIDKNAGLYDIFPPKKLESLKDLFGSKKLKGRRAKWNDGISVISNGDFFFHQSFLLDQTGNAVVGIDDDNTRFYVAAQTPILAACHIKEHKLILFDLHKMTPVLEMPIEEEINQILISPGGDRLVLGQPLNKKSPEWRNISIYTISDSGLQELAKETCVQNVSISEEFILFRHGGRLVAIDKNGHRHISKIVFPHTLEDWTLIHDGKTIYPLNPTFDHEKMDAGHWGHRGLEIFPRLRLNLPAIHD